MSACRIEWTCHARVWGGSGALGMPGRQRSASEALPSQHAQGSRPAAAPSHMLTSFLLSSSSTSPRITALFTPCWHGIATGAKDWPGRGQGAF